jgi:hypothetical protein
VLASAASDGDGATTVVKKGGDLPTLIRATKTSATPIVPSRLKS